MFKQLPLYTFLGLRQGFQVNEHVLVVCPQFLHLLFLHSDCVFQSRDFIVLLLNHEAHLLCLRLQIDQSLLRVP